MSSNKGRLVIIIIFWINFLIWQIGVQLWINAMAGSFLRVDLLIILPGLVVVTVYFLVKTPKP